MWVQFLSLGVEINKIMLGRISELARMITLYGRKSHCLRFLLFALGFGCVAAEKHVINNQ